MKKESVSVPWRDILRIAGTAHLLYLVLLLFLSLMAEKEYLPEHLLKGTVGCAAACAFFLSAVFFGGKHSSGRLLLCGLSAAGFLLPLVILGLTWYPGEFLGWFFPLALLVLAAVLAASLVKGSGRRKAYRRSHPGRRKKK